MIRTIEGILVVGGKLLIVAKLRVLKALAHWQLGEQKQAKSAMIQGLALLGEQPFRRFVLDEEKPHKVLSVSSFKKLQKLSNLVG